MKRRDMMSVEEPIDFPRNGPSQHSATPGQASQSSFAIENQTPQEKVSFLHYSKSFHLHVCYFNLCDLSSITRVVKQKFLRRSKISCKMSRFVRTLYASKCQQIFVFSLCVSLFFQIYPEMKANAKNRRTSIEWIKKYLLEGKLACSYFALLMKKILISVSNSPFRLSRMNWK